MSFITDFYYCYECKKSVDKLEDLLFVEAGSTRSFCNEKCIEKYFKPITDDLEKTEKSFRKKYALETEKCLEYLNDISIMESVMTAPDEMWCLENGIKEEVFSFIKKIELENKNPFYVVVLCSIFDTYPGYVLLSTVTESKFLMEEFRIGEEVDIEEHFSENLIEDGSMSISNNEVEIIDKKKSTILERHIDNLSIADIPVDKYELYEEYLETTMEDPDQVFKRNDDDGDTLFTYIKAYDKQGVSFYYFVVCMKLDMEGEEGEEVIVPILTFPSVDGDLYRLYHEGEQVSGPLKN
jgi:hypothetical protein